MLNSDGEPLAEIEYSEIEWIIAYYDGPLSGIVRMPQGELAYFHTDPDSDVWPPEHFLVVALSEDEQQKFVRIKELWDTPEQGKSESRDHDDLPGDIEAIEDMVKDRQAVAFILL